jgi:hypothetical protein
MERLGGLYRDETPRGQMVLDIIDPNLFPFDTLSPSNLKPKGSKELQDMRKQSRPWSYEDLREKPDNMKRLFGSNDSDDSSAFFQYQWLASEVAVREGKAKFTSPISGVVANNDMNILSYTLTQMLPLFSAVCGQNLDDTDLQVIVKCQTYQLSPGDTYKGEFHREGILDQEHILAVGLYYYTFDSCLSGGDLELNLVINRGCGGTQVDEMKIPTQETKAIVFKNTLVFHRLAELSHVGEPQCSHSSSSSMPSFAQRSVLAFFLIDPNVRIPSTLHHPPSNTGSEKVLAMVSQHLPAPVAIIVQGYAGIFLTEEELLRRDEIIKERRRPMAGPRSYVRGGHMD